MFKSNSTLCAALLALLCTLPGCGAGPWQTETATAPQEAPRDEARPASAIDAVRMASALHASGADAEALTVIAGAYRRFPNDPAVISAYGRLAAINGQDELAARPLREALAIAPGDWRALSAHGVLASRAGRQDDARSALIRARAASGNDAVALNNVAVSFILDGDAPEAERLLRQALASPALKDSHRRRIRRNLAVALAVQGNATAAAQIAGTALPPGLHNASRATLRRVMGLGERGGGPSEASSAAPDSARGWRPVEVQAGS